MFVFAPPVPDTVGPGLLRALVLAFGVSLLMPVASVAAEWSFAWTRDDAAGEYACTAASGVRRVRTGAGSTETTVRLGIQGDGYVTIESDPVPFDTARIYESWVRVDENPIVVRMNQSPDGRRLTFSEEDSIALHRQFETGTVITVSLVFAPPGKIVTQQFSLDGYNAIVPQYKGCKGLLLNPGWMGMSMTSAPGNDAPAAWIRSNTDYQKPGAIVVTVDPRKEAAKNDLRPGDRIIGVNGRETEVKDIIAALKSTVTGSAVELDVLRKDARMTKRIIRPAASDAAE